MRPEHDQRFRYSSLVLSLLLVLIYGLELVFPSIPYTFSLVAADFLSRPWTIVTSIFLHSPSDYMHLLNNLFFLAVFGLILENHIGVRRFLVFFLVAGVLANFSAFVFYPNSTVLGASGAISGVVAALAVLKPRNIGLLWGVPVPMWAVLLGWVGINLLGFGSDSTIAFEAHLIGLGIGALYGLYLREGPEEGEEEDVDIDVEEWEDRYMKEG